MITDIDRRAGASMRHLHHPEEELRLRLGNPPLSGGRDHIRRKIQTTQQLTRPGGLIAGDDHAHAQTAQRGQRRSDVVVQIALVEIFAMTGYFTCAVLGCDIDAGADETEGIGVVAALRHDGFNEGRDSVTGDPQPVSPRRPVAVVPRDRLSDIQHHCLNHPGSLRRASRDREPSNGGRRGQQSASPGGAADAAPQLIAAGRDQIDCLAVPQDFHSAARRWSGAPTPTRPERVYLGFCLTKKSHRVPPQYLSDIESR